MKLRIAQIDMGLMRLACRYCDRTDCDGIIAPPPEWEDVRFFQSANDAKNTGWGSCGEWWTDLGTCPTCQSEAQ